MKANESWYEVDLVSDGDAHSTCHHLDTVICEAFPESNLTCTNHYGTTHCEIRGILKSETKTANVLISQVGDKTIRLKFILGAQDFFVDFLSKLFEHYRNSKDAGGNPCWIALKGEMPQLQTKFQG